MTIILEGAGLGVLDLGIDVAQAGYEVYSSAGLAWLLWINSPIINIRAPNMSNPRGI